MTRARFVVTVQRKNRDRSRSLSVSQVHRERPPRSHGTVRIRESVPARAAHVIGLVIIGNFGTIRTLRTCPANHEARAVAERAECGASLSVVRTLPPGQFTAAPRRDPRGRCRVSRTVPRASTLADRRARRDSVRAESAEGATSRVSRARGTAFALSSPSRGDRGSESRFTAGRDRDPMSNGPPGSTRWV
jgi:hypothetical protein